MEIKKEWMKSEIEELIFIYEGKPELWDVKSKIYRDRFCKKSSLSEMAEHFGTSIDEIQRKIHNLRNQFHNEFRKSCKKNSGQNNEELYVSKWPYYNLLTFLQPCSVCKPSIGNLQMDDAVQEITPSDDQDTFKQSAFLEPEKRLKNNVTKQMDCDSIVKKAILALNEEEDQYEIFGRYVASEMRTLSSDYLRKKMKRKFQEIILEINEEDEQMSNPNPS